MRLSIIDTEKTLMIQGRDKYQQLNPGYKNNNNKENLDRTYFKEELDDWGCGRFFGLDYAARPRLRRYSIGLIASKDILIRSSLYQRRKPSSSYMNSSRETPSQDLV